MNKQKHILYLDDEINCLQGVGRSLRHRSNDFNLSLVSDPIEAFSVLKNCQVDVVVSDMRMPEMSGIEFLQVVSHKYPEIPRIILSGAADLPSAISAINEIQVFRFLTKPCDGKTISIAIDEALQQNLKTKELSKRDSERIVNLKSALDCVSLGFIIVDESGTVLFANQKASEFMRLHNGLLLTPKGQCRASTSAQTRKFMHGIKQICSEEIKVTPRLVLNGISSEKRDFTVFGIRLPHETMPDHRRSLAGLFISDLGDEQSFHHEIIAELFGLTASEAKIACDLVAGKSLESAAKNANVTLSTARTYLKRIFSKTGTSKQTQLTSLIIRSNLGISIA